MTEISVALILRTQKALAADLTAVMGVMPSRAYNRGDVPHGGRRKHFQAPMAHTSWVLDADENTTAPLQDHLRALTGAVPIERFREFRHCLPNDVRVEIDIGVYYDGQSGHIEFPPESLAIVTAYGATLLVTSYYSEEKGGSEQSPSTDTHITLSTGSRLDAPRNPVSVPQTRSRTRRSGR